MIYLDRSRTTSKSMTMPNEKKKKDGATVIGIIFFYMKLSIFVINISVFRKVLD